MKNVYLVKFVQQLEDVDDRELLIGVYETLADARAAISRVKERKGFADYPQGFQIHPYEINKDHWTEGFILA